MYAVVFLTLLVALIAGYGQMFSRQAADNAAQQVGISDQVFAWHTTALDLARKFIRQTSVTAAGCSLTNLVGGGVPAFSPCAYSAGNAYVSATNYTALPLCSASAAAPCMTTLPLGYQAADYRFYSVAFSAGTPTRYYLLTYVPPNKSDDFLVGLVCLPGNVAGGTSCNAPHKQFSVSFAEFMAQMKRNPRLSQYSFGSVLSAGVLTTASVSSAFGVTSLNYTVPGVAFVPANSVGVITEFTPCSAC